MMHNKRLVAVACAALLSVPFAVSAQESEESTSPFSASFGVTTDYVFRGVSQTDEDPTLQAGFTYTSPVGLYAGVWGSGVDFGDGGPDAEVDYLIGYAFDDSSLYKGLSLLLQVNNLTNSPYTTRLNTLQGGGSYFPEVYEEYGRQFLLGVSYKL